MRRPWPRRTDCIGRSACIPHRGAAHRFGYSCKDHPHSRGRRSTLRYSLLPSTHPLHYGNSSTDHRRRSHCQRRPWLRHSDCIGKTRCIGHPEQVRPTRSSLTTYHHRCRSRSRDSRSIERRWNTRRRNCDSSCALRRRECRCWRTRPTRRSGYTRWSRCTPRRAPARRCSRHHLRTCR